MNLVKRSIEIIHQGQSETGAYLASPTFNTYRYSWFRDGSFIAHAMDTVSEHASAVRFHKWVASTLVQKQDLMRCAVQTVKAGRSLEPTEVLHTRYTVDGHAANEDWPNHQLDGFGTWLWALAEHKLRFGGRLPDGSETTIHLLADYLQALWQQPCYDCWEEFPDQLHPHTLSAVYAGLQAAQQLTGISYSCTLDQIRSLVNGQAAPQGYFIKFLGSPLVDASLMGLALPYQLIPLDDPRMQATIARIETDLLHNGGVQRYSQDTYYGGGEWVLLSAWLGWLYVSSGQHDKAHAIRSWIESTADDIGQLPEQVPQFLNDKTQYQPWVERWGEIARPLLWSHAMYLILVDALD
jgi:GH15 family glucan-1,4-alpha-glucosidase